MTTVADKHAEKDGLQRQIGCGVACRCMMTLSIGVET